MTMARKGLAAAQRIGVARNQVASIGPCYYASRRLAGSHSVGIGSRVSITVTAGGLLLICRAFYEETVQDERVVVDDLRVLPDERFPLRALSKVAPVEVTGGHVILKTSPVLRRRLLFNSVTAQQPKEVQVTGDTVVRGWRPEARPDKQKGFSSRRGLTKCSG